MSADGNTSLRELLNAHDPEAQAVILKKLLDERADPNDPVYDLLRLFQLTLQTNEQTVRVVEQIPEQVRALMEEVDGRFDTRAAQFRAIPADVATMVKDGVVGVVPSIRDEAKALAVDAFTDELKSIRSEINRVALGAMQAVADKAKASATKVDPKRIAMQANIVFGLFGIVVTLIGFFGGLGWRTAYPKYPPMVALAIKRGEAFQAMWLDPSMPVGVRVWIREWQTSH
jgi:hypothetical protein